MRRSERGSGIVLALFFLSALFLLARAFQLLLPTELNAALRFKTDTAAYFAADAAIQDSAAWVENELQNSREVTSGTSRRGTLGDWSWTAVIDGDPENPPTGTNPLRMYKVTATATLRGRSHRRITSWIGQQTFAKFAYFADKVQGSAAYNLSSSQFRGPFHVNEALRLFVPSGWYGTTGEPSFGASVTSATTVNTSPDGISYGGPGGDPYDASGKAVPGRYERIYTGGRQAVRTGVRRVEMPGNSANVATSAWGDPSMPAPTAAGVYVNSAAGSDDAAGGVYIVGNVDTMALATDAAGNRSVRIRQGGTQTTVTETLGGPLTAPNGHVVQPGQTLVVKTPGNHVQILRSVTNGVVYGTGNIDSLQGVNKGARTIAVDVAAQRQITLTGHITRSDTAVGEAPDGTADGIGILGYEVHISSTIPRNVGQPLYVYAVLMGGSPTCDTGIVVDRYNSGGVGLLKLYGGFISSRAPLFGTRNHWGTTTNGYEKICYYDPNLARRPPPFFPTFAKLTVRYWKEEALVQ